MTNWKISRGATGTRSVPSFKATRIATGTRAAPTFASKHGGGAGPPVSITSTSPLPNATAGTAYTYTFTASGGATPYTWTATGVPSWATLSSSGVLSGTPSTAAAAVTMSVTVTGSGGTTATGSFSLTVQAASVTLAITSTSPLPSATTSVAYVYTFGATGGTTPYHWSATGLPTWAALSTAGVLTGTPATPASAVTMSVTVTDAASHTATASFAITVVAAGAAWVNGQSLTLGLPATGLTTFGTKSGSTPLIWDHGQSGVGTMNTVWGDYGPRHLTGANAIGNMTNRSFPLSLPGASVAVKAPTPYTSVAMGGCHYLLWNEVLGADTGGSDAIEVKVTDIWNAQAAMASGPVYEVVDYYLTHHPDWWFTIGPGAAAALAGFQRTAGSTTVTGLYSQDATIIKPMCYPNPAGMDRGFASSSGTGVTAGTAVVSVDTVGLTLTLAAAATATSSANDFGIGRSNGWGDQNLKTAWIGSLDTSIGAQLYYENIATGITLQRQSGLGLPQTGSYSYIVPNASMGNNAYQAYSPAGYKAQYGAKPDSGWQFINPDNNGHSSAYWALAVPNPADPRNSCNGNVNGWVKVTEITRWDTTTTGWRNVYWNNVSTIWYAGPTMLGPPKVAHIPNSVETYYGGYSRNQGVSDNGGGHNSSAIGTRSLYRFFANFYKDRQSSGTGRVILTNDASWSPGNGNWFETQPYTAWSTNSITITLNLGNINSGSAYLWFIDEANGVSTPVRLASGTI